MNLRGISALASGALFGIGLAVSGMVDPLRVLGFLDVAGAWDPTLAFVMIGALMVAAPAYLILGRREVSVCGDPMQVPKGGRVDRRLLAGAAVFGAGWGLAGYCPGPAIAGFAVMWPELVWFVPAYALGSWLAGSLNG